MKKQRFLCFALAVSTVISFSGGAWAGDGVVALQTADPSCPDDSSNIYVDCGNGTVTDNRTGLVWLKDANCFLSAGWHEAMGIVAGLSDVAPDFCADKGQTAANCDCGLSDGSSPGEWRLPSASEWQTMIDDALGEGGDPDCRASPPTITNDTGGGCWVSGPSSFANVGAILYWSSTTWRVSTIDAWYADLTLGGVETASKSALLRVWPVRGGQ